MSENNDTIVLTPFGIVNYSKLGDNKKRKLLDDKKRKKIKDNDKSWNHIINNAEKMKKLEFDLKKL